MKPASRESREARINRLAKKLSLRFERRIENPVFKIHRKPLRLKERKRARVKHLIAFDLETTRIEAGTPSLIYLTAFSLDLGIRVSVEVRTPEQLLAVLEARLLDDELSGARFVGWNANNFDTYFIVAALLHSNDYILRPYLTKGKKIRGLKVIRKDNDKISWEFLDGIAMTGIQKPLKKFLEIFAPEFQKLDGPNFDAETFDPKNEAHVAYADRDSEGLWHALQKAQSITVDNFNLGLQPTIGNLGIKAFQSHIASDVIVWPLPVAALRVIRQQVMRGGYCHCARRYYGPVWKYDINQAYAAAMRECLLPSGRCIRHRGKGKNKFAKAAIYRVSGKSKIPGGLVPFYWKNEGQKAQFTNDEISNAWLTSIETEQLESEGWKLEYHEGYFWDSVFRMQNYVGKLEELRIHGPGGPKGAQGEMIKAIGNNSYGKTVEQLEGLELLVAQECPPGYAPYQDEEDLFHHLWFKFSNPSIRDYHQPQLGAFITAHVRMVLRRAILLAPDAWLYADTDGLMFSRPVALDINATRYGAWKQEAAGEHYRLITKKVYANEDASEKHAKGVNINRLTSQDFKDWFSGSPPVQTQTQRSNFLSAMTGAEMYFSRTKTGQKIDSQTA